MKTVFLTAASALSLSLASTSAASLQDPISTWFSHALQQKALPEIDQTSLTKEQASMAQYAAWNAYKAAALAQGWDKEILPVGPAVDPVAAATQRPNYQYAELSAGDKKMPYTLITRGEKPAGGWPLFIALHGGGKYHGSEPMEPHGWNVNTREWQSQQILSTRFYQPAGLYLVPRMADDNLGRWWHKHNIEIFTKAIRNAILFNEVDPNKVYILGISQGGYGTSHLGPLLADHFAAAGPMAGGMMTVAENLRNLPFRTDIGEHDKAYKRIELAKELHDKLDALKENDPQGYTHKLAIQKGRGHGIDYRANPTWLAQHTRNPFPEKIHWRSHEKQGHYQTSFYWISTSQAPSEGEFEITAALDKASNSIALTATEYTDAEDKKALQSADLIVHLNDQMLDLDKAVTITLNGKPAFKGKVQRTQANIARNLLKRGDINYAFPAEITLSTKL